VSRPYPELRRTFVVVALVAITFLAAAIPAFPVARSDAAGLKASSTTSWPSWCPGSPDSLYTSATQSGDVTQLFNGSIKGCFRVPDDRSSTLHVAWQSFVQLSHSADTPTTTSGVSNSDSDGHFKLSLSATTVHPGQHITVIGRYLSGHRPSNTESGILCWDGCQNGLQEQGQNLKWVSSTEFRTTLLVPNAPWFESDHGKATVHSLSSGTYPVGIECVTVTSGCATRAADTQINVHLVAPKATWCTNSLPCGSLHVNSVHTSVGDVVEVEGRAPLVDILSQPWGYWLEYSVHSLGDKVVSYHSPVTVETTATIAPITLSVTTGATWASQNLAPLNASSWSSIYQVTPGPKAASFVTCNANAIVTTGAGRTLSVPTTAAGAVLVSHHLNINSSKSAGACASALVDPANPSHVFASFYSAQSEEIPPTFLAGLYTTNGGASWDLVPTPPGHTSYEFGGFQEVGDIVSAVFVNNGNVDSGSKTTLVTEETANGGQSWTQSSLGCPRSGACVIFGPSSPGHCAMNGQPEPVYFGTPSDVGGGAVFRESRWITEVNACFSQELVSTTTGTVLLLDPSSISPLVATGDGGQTWYNVQIPRLAGMGLGDQDNWLVMDSQRALLATTSNNKGDTSLYMLSPHATSWCKVLTLAKGYANYVSPLRVSGDDLYWSQSHNNRSTLRVERTTSLRCQ
jgi:hypothetical protein